MLIIIPCGNKKRNIPSKAKDLYIGGYFKLCLAYALSHTDESNIRIISAKYGLLKLNDVIEPYDLQMGQAGCVTPYYVRQQAEAQGILRETDIHLVTGKAYAKVLLKVWPHAKPTLDGVGTIGYQKQWLKQNTKKGI